MASRPRQEAEAEPTGCIYGVLVTLQSAFASPNSVSKTGTKLIRFGWSDGIDSEVLIQSCNESLIHCFIH
jgi:hypothetical protein